MKKACAARSTQELKQLLDRVRQVLRLEHYTICTEKAGSGWITRYI